MSETQLGIIASAVFLVRLIPQPLRLARTGVAAGVSPLAGLASTVAAGAWFVHGVHVNLPIVWAVSAVALVPALWTNALLVHHTTRRDVWLTCLWCTVLAATWLAGAFATALAFGVLVSTGPAVVRTWTEDDISGIAASTWWMSILDAACWGAYGWASQDTALIGYFVALTSCSTAVLARLHGLLAPPSGASHVAG